jgi:ATP-dependent Clp protease protease subunit
LLACKTFGSAAVTFLSAVSLQQGYRYSMPHSILMMHHPSGASRGQASEMHIESRELVRVRDYLSLVISDSTGQPYDRVSWLYDCPSAF